MNTLRLLLASCVLPALRSICVVVSLVSAVGCVWTEASYPSPPESKADPLPNTATFTMSIGPDGAKLVDKVLPDELDWAKSCSAQAHQLDPCLRAWTDDEVKFKREKPVTMKINDFRFTSYFHVKDEDGTIIDPERILSDASGKKFSEAETFRRMELYDRRLWIEQCDLAALAESRVPGHAMPSSQYSSGINPRDQLPELMFRVGLSYDAECVKRQGEPNFNLGLMRERGFVGRITGRFVAWNPDEKYLQEIRQMTMAMAKEESLWHHMELAWHKQSGSTMWWSDTVVMLSTYDTITNTSMLTFRRPEGLYDPNQVDFKNHGHALMRLGEWLRRDNPAPFHLQTLFPSSDDALAKWTIPTVLPRVPRQQGAIFIPTSVEVIIATQNQDTKQADTVSLGCIPFETRGLHGAVKRQIARHMLPQQGVKHETTVRIQPRTDPMAGLLTGSR
ncbi:MAG: hypothetical protein ACOYUZ_01145 [Patescibacteria group bacterium]